MTAQAILDNNQESSVSASCGPKRLRPGEVAIGTNIEAVPVTGLTESFSPIPRIAPPPFGSESVGGVVRKLFRQEGTSVTARGPEMFDTAARRRRASETPCCVSFGDRLVVTGRCWDGFLDLGRTNSRGD